MTEKKGNLKSTFRSRQAEAINTSGNWKNAGTGEKTYKYFGYEKGHNHARRFKLMFRDGRSTSISYSTLPIINYDPSGILTVKTGSLEIRITGRSLDKIEEYLSAEKVTWIKESYSNTDDETAEVFISEIRIDENLEG